MTTTIDKLAETTTTTLNNLKETLTSLRGYIFDDDEHRTDQPHEHCWHDRDFVSIEGMLVEYQQCCRCDVTPEDMKAQKGPHAL